MSLGEAKIPRRVRKFQGSNFERKVRGNVNLGDSEEERKVELEHTC